MNDEGECSCKFRRVLEKYSLQTFEREVQKQWEHPDGPGLRELADKYNKKILSAALESEGELPLDGEVQNIYRLLVDDDVSSGNYTRVKNRLNQKGVDPDVIESDFISYQTVNRHFKNCRGLSQNRPQTKSKTQQERVKDRILALKARTSRVTENELQQLSQSGKISLEEPSVFVSISVTCESCNSVLSLEDILDGESCDCLDSSQVVV